MFVWNRTEVLVTASRSYYRQVLAALLRNGIRHQTREVKLTTPEEGDSNMLRRCAKEYHLYVHSDDKEQVEQIIAEVNSVLDEAEPGLAQ